ncbi:DJ-1/PfpI family protein [Jatrophihabitans sp. YIM 134969]
MPTIGIAFFDGMEELDAVGPYEVLAAWTQHHPEDGWALITLSRSGAAVTGAKGLQITPSHSWASAPPLALVVYPGGRGTRELVNDAEELAWIRELAATASVMTSVCTGSLLYAAAGLLQNRPATTHWSELDELVALDPSVDVRPDQRFVDDGSVITAAGVSAGIDMGLHLVARLSSYDRARETRRYIQYDPEPPV